MTTDFNKVISDFSISASLDDYKLRSISRKIEQQVLLFRQLTQLTSDTLRNMESEPLAPFRAANGRRCLADYELLSLCRTLNSLPHDITENVKELSAAVETFSANISQIVDAYIKFIENEDADDLNEDLDDEDLKEEDDLDADVAISHGDPRAASACPKEDLPF